MRKIEVRDPQVPVRTGNDVGDQCGKWTVAQPVNASDLRHDWKDVELLTGNVETHQRDSRLGREPEGAVGTDGEAVWIPVLSQADSTSVRRKVEERHDPV